MMNRKMKSWFSYNNTKSFYLGFFTSVGMLTTCYFITYIYIKAFEKFMEVSLYENTFFIAFMLLYTFYFLYTYKMIRNDKFMRNGFVIFTIVIVLYTLILYILR